MTADDADRLVSELSAIFQWIDGNHCTLRGKLDHPLEEGFRNLLGAGGWTEAHDKLTTFQTRRIVQWLRGTARTTSKLA